ncbi:MAG: SRPBCC family protein [Nitrospirota bacterium]
MSTIETSIEVNVPVQTAYHQWTQFEEFSLFMEGVKEVYQLDARHLHWKAEIGGQEQEWEAEIIDQTPDECIAWRSRNGAIYGGILTFHPLSNAKSKVLLQVGYIHEGVLENGGGGEGIVSLRVQRGLERYKEFIENRAHTTGAWWADWRSKARTSFFGLGLFMAHSVLP